VAFNDALCTRQDEHAARKKVSDSQVPVGDVALYGSRGFSSTSLNVTVIREADGRTPRPWSCRCQQHPKPRAAAALVATVAWPVSASCPPGRSTTAPGTCAAGRPRGSGRNTICAVSGRTRPMPRKAVVGVAVTHHVRPDPPGRVPHVGTCPSAPVEPVRFGVGFRLGKKSLDVRS